MEQRVLLVLTDTVSFPIAFFGAIKIGAVPVPVNTLLTTEDYDGLLRDSRAVALIVSASLYGKVAPASRSSRSSGTSSSMATSPTGRVGEGNAFRRKATLRPGA